MKRITSLNQFVVGETMLYRWNAFKQEKVYGFTFKVLVVMKDEISIKMQTIIAWPKVTPGALFIQKYIGLQHLTAYPIIEIYKLDDTDCITV